MFEHPERRLLVADILEMGDSAVVEAPTNSSSPYSGLHIQPRDMPERGHLGVTARDDDPCEMTAQLGYIPDLMGCELPTQPAMPIERHLTGVWQRCLGRKDRSVRDQRNVVLELSK